MSQGNDTSSFEQSQVMQSLDTLHHPWLHPQQQQQQQQQQQSVSGDQSNLLWDLSSDHSRLYSSPLELFSGSRNGDIFFEGSATAIESVNNADGVQDSTTNQHSTLTARGLNHSGTESGDPLRNEGGRGDSGDEDVSDQGDDDDEQRALGRSGKRHHSKNLIAERNRRKKLNDRLYHLRSLVPKITKMDRASILGDAIEYVLELQKQVKELQDQLEEMNLEEDGGRQQNGSNVDTLMNDDGNGGSQRMEQDDSPNSVRMAASNTKIASNLQDISGNDDKGQHQMEPQVEVRQLDGDDFFLRVLCEHKKGGFTKLMEAVSSLGLEVTNANVTTYQSLVLNVFTVKKMDNNNEVVQAEEVRDSLLELTRNPSLGWPDGGQGVVGGGGDYHSQQQLHHQRRHHLSSHHHLNYFQHQI